MWGLEVTDLPTVLGAIATLVLLEGLLSADNALVLAVMVRHLPDRRLQKRALRYGICGAFAFRLIAVLAARYLLGFWQLEVVGGAYLLVLALKHLAAGEGDPVAAGTDAPRRRHLGFWATVANVEIADIIFSVDSILAAVAMVNSLPAYLRRDPNLALAIIYLGGVLGIVAMRYVAGIFLILLDRFKGLAVGAYFLVAWIGLKLIGGGLHHAFDPGRHRLGADWWRLVPGPIASFPWEMDERLFWAGMGVIIVVSLLYKPRPRPARALPVPAPAVPPALRENVVRGPARPAAGPSGLLNR